MGFILASGSASRRAILENAGLDFEIDPADVDEPALTEAFRGEASDLALMLAEAKALAVSRRREGLVLGADQVLAFKGEIYGKAKTPDEARARLERFRGDTHHLLGGIAAARGGEVIWRFKSASAMHVRAFSDDFLDDYMRRAGDILTKGVGAYAFEGLGAQLFERVEGDYYAVLGLPLLPVLAMLRREGAAPV